MARKPSVKYRAGKPTNLMRAVGGLFEEIAFSIQTWLIDNDRVATGNTVNSFQVNVFKNKATLTAASSVKYALQGREGGGPEAPLESRPPISAIKAWIQAKPVPIPEGMTLTSLAFAIATKINQDGTNPPKLDDDDIEAFYERAFQKYSDRTGDAVAREALNQLNQIFSKNGFTVN